MQIFFDSPTSERVYGFGLEYTYTNFKGRTVHIVTSEGGIGRGLLPLTPALNAFGHGAGGNPLTTYAPTYSFATSLRRGILLKNHTEIGHVDFESAQDNFGILLWKTTELNLNVVVGNTMKEVVSGITHFVGR